jgi:hypothetical protein
VEALAPDWPLNCYVMFRRCDYVALSKDLVSSRLFRAL